MSTMVLTGHPDSPRTWVNSLREHVPVLLMLARKDFQTRYKRATFGVLWAVAVPLLQASIMAVVFSRVVRVGTGPAYGVHVMAGVIPFTYFSSVLTMGATSIVEGSGLTEKVWFPRAILVIVPALSNLVGLLVTISVLLIATPILGGHLGVHTLLLVPATLLLIAFATSLALVLSALHVYFRDVKFLVQAALLVWMYVTPILYPPTFLGRLKDAIYANPLTGIVLLFQKATAGSTGPWRVPVLVSVAVTAVLFVVGAEAHRRHDRLFVDLL